MNEKIALFLQETNLSSNIEDEASESILFRTKIRCQTISLMKKVTAAHTELKF